MNEQNNQNFDNQASENNNQDSIGVVDQPPIEDPSAEEANEPKCQQSPAYKPKKIKFKVIIAALLALVAITVIFAIIPHIFHIHNFGEWDVIKAPTCISEGEKIRSCSCGEIQSVTVPKSASHNYTSRVETEATCTVDGKRVFTCVDCNNSYTETVMAAHSWRDATCTTPKKCSECGITVGSALGHTTTNGTCTRCNTNINPNLVIYNALKNYIINYGTYDLEDHEYKYSIITSYSSDDETKYEQYLRYNVADEVIVLNNFSYSSSFSSLVTISIDKSVSGSYTWSYVDSYNYLMRGTLIAATYTSATVLGYSYSNITNFATRSSVLDFASSSVDLFLTVFDVYASKPIGVSPKDLGFLKYD